MILDIYMSFTNKIGFFIFGVMGYISVDMLNVLYYGSLKNYFYIKIRNTIILSIIGYYTFPYILPIYFYFYF